MSMNHNAFVFDHATFERELSPILLRALESRTVTGLVAWIEAERESLVDPYEGEPLLEDWEKAFVKRDVQEFGDIALTKYYDPTESVGLDDTWQDVGAALAAAGLGEALILGTPFGTAEHWFDPGVMGSYFQSATTVVANLELVERLLEQPLAAGRDGVEAARRMLRSASAARSGLYVTF